MDPAVLRHMNKSSNCQHISSLFQTAIDRADQARKNCAPALFSGGCIGNTVFFCKAAENNGNQKQDTNNQ